MARISGVALAVLIASGVFAYQTISSHQDKQANANALSQARKDCADKIHPQGLDVYADYNQCVASKGFDEFKK
jgi:hypothetical protein